MFDQTFDQTIAYFSMEVAIADEIPTFSGGLGVLAGDFLRAIADAKVPAVAVTLLYHKGFFRQELDASGRQVEEPVEWNPADYLEHLENQVTITLAGRTVTVGVWRYLLAGVTGFETPIYFLDTDLAANAPEDRSITDRLYSGGPEARLSQEAVLGLAGPEMLASVGHRDVAMFHMNEGHASLVALVLLGRRVGAEIIAASPEDLDAVRASCAFTTHTPVPAGHDRFSADVAIEILGRETVGALATLGCLDGGTLNMTVLGMFFSGFINGVAKRHGEVSQAMFPEFHVQSITNGIHARTWVSPSSAQLFDVHLSGWREDNTLLAGAEQIPLEEVAAAHRSSKRALLAAVADRSAVNLDPDALTIGIARRAAAYKRNDLIFHDVAVLEGIVKQVGPIQILCSGKAHPNDGDAKRLIAHIGAVAEQLAGEVAVVYLADYGMALASLLVGGVDLWLNNPVAPHEASGTSGMKAAVNGVPSLSTLDGWWVEGWVEGVTGWAIGTDRGPVMAAEMSPEIDASDAAELYRVLGEVIAPMYYEKPNDFTTVCRSAISINGAYFTTERMLGEYVARAYQRHVPIDA